jgi:hypothetical protein
VDLDLDPISNPYTNGKNKKKKICTSVYNFLTFFIGKLKIGNNYFKKMFCQKVTSTFNLELKKFAFKTVLCLLGSGSGLKSSGSTTMVII